MIFHSSRVKSFSLIGNGSILDVAGYTGSGPVVFVHQFTDREYGLTCIKDKGVGWLVSKTYK